MADHDPNTGVNPKEATILRLIQERIATKLDQIEKDKQEHDTFLSSLKAEIDSLIEVGTNISKEIEENEAKQNSARGLGMKIDVEDDTGRTITAPLSTREVKTGLLGKNPSDPKNRRLSHQGKSDKPTSLTDVAEEQKKETPKPGKKPVTTVPAKQPKPDKPAVKTPAETKKAGGKAAQEEEKKEHTETTKTENADEKKEHTEHAEGSQTSVEKTPEQIAVDSVKAITKKGLTEACSLPSPPSEVIKTFEATLVAIGEKSQTWITASKVGKSADFTKRLSEVKAEALSDTAYKKIKKILGEDAMNPDAVAKKSATCKHLVQWLQALLTLREQAKGSEEAPEKTEGHDAEAKKEEAHGEEKKEEHTEAADANQEKTPEQIAKEEGHNAVKVLNKKDITEIAAYSNPPELVQKTLELTLLALGEKVQTWATAQKVLKNSDFLKRVTAVDAVAIPAPTFKKIKQKMNHVNHDDVAKISSAASALASWLQSLMKVREIVKGADEFPDEPAKEDEPEAKPTTKKTPTVTKKDDKKEEKKEPEKKPGVPKTPAVTKKDDKKDGEDKPKEAEKKPGVPKATTGKADKEEKKTDEKKADDKKTTTTKTTETKKPELQHANPELKTIIEAISATDVSEIKTKKNAAALTTLQAISLLTSGKDGQWTDINKNILHDIASLYKVLDVDAHSLVKKNVDAANKKLSDKTLETSINKAGEGANNLYKWAKAAIKIAHEKADAHPAGEANADAAHKEEHKPEEPKDQQHTVEAEKKETEHKEEHHAEEKPAEAEAKTEEHQPAKEEHHEEPAKEEHHEPAKEEHHEAPKEENHEPAKEEHAQEEHKQESHETHANGDHAQSNNVEAESKVEESHAGNGDIQTDNKEAESELSSVLGHDVSTEIHGNLKEFVNKKLKEADSELQAVERQNEDFRKENVPENPERKPYEIKQSTKEFIQMVQQEWVHELKANENWDEKIYQILDLLFLVQGSPDVPDLSDHGKVRSYAISKLEKEEGDLGGYLMGLEKNLDLSIERKVQIQEFLKDKTAILNPSSFDGVDALCGVISFLMKEASEYLGVIPTELAKKAAAKEKIYLLNQEKIDFYNNRKNKLTEIANKHGISLE